MKHLVSNRNRSPRVKRYLAAIVALLLILSVSTTALAENKKGGGQSQQGGSSGQPPQSSPKQSASGQEHANGKSNGPSNTGVPEEANDGTGRMQNRPAMDTNEIAAAIAALEDSNTQKATLTTLLNAYETALAAQSADGVSSRTNEEQKTLADAVQAAERALLEATKAAGITGGVGRGQFVNGYGNAPMDTESIAAAIAALDDSDANKATLTNLLAAYEAARTAQTSADTTSLAEDEIAALADATRAAEQALQEALKNAGLAEEPIQEQNQRQIQTQTTQGGGATPSFELNVLEDGETSAGSESTGLFSALLQWLSNLVK